MFLPFALLVATQKIVSYVKTFKGLLFQVKSGNTSLLACMDVLSI